MRTIQGAMIMPLRAFPDLVGGRVDHDEAGEGEGLHGDGICKVRAASPAELEPAIGQRKLTDDACRKFVLRSTFV